MKFVCEKNIHIYELAEKNKILIEDFNNFRMIKIQKNEKLLKILLFLLTAKSLEEIQTKFNLTKIESEKITKKLLELKIIKKIKENIIPKKKLNIAIFGCGTFGSNIYFMLTKMDFIKEITLIDYDTIESDNIKRQFFTNNNIGKSKIDILKKYNKNKEIKINKINKQIKNVEDLRTIADHFKQDLIINCSDEPSWKETTYWTSIVAKENNIPFISSGGYINEIVSLPKFYYPNDNLNLETTINKINKIFTSSNSKPNTIDVWMACILINKQIQNFYNNEIPIYYKKIGFFDNEKFEWKI